MRKIDDKKSNFVGSGLRIKVYKRTEADPGEKKRREKERGRKEGKDKGGERRRGDARKYGGRDWRKEGEEALRARCCS